MFFPFYAQPKAVIKTKRYHLSVHHSRATFSLLFPVSEECLKTSWGSVGRAVTFDTRDVCFECRNWKFYLLSTVLNLCRKDESKENTSTAQLT